MTDTETDWVALIGPEPIFIERRGNVMIYLDMERRFFWRERAGRHALKLKYAAQHFDTLALCRDSLMARH
jgi:hypothetical protein